ncbi:hypothetical protein BHM03_00020477 [Ensete ventricosum]|nr:hypothetical protein BHM03_00020477 [Ensete ventricosum]
MANVVSLSHTALGSYSSRPIRASSNGSLSAVAAPLIESVPKSGGPAILELPLNKIRRPLMRTRANDPEKVNELMESIRLIGLQEPETYRRKPCGGGKGCGLGLAPRAVVRDNFSSQDLDLS